MDNDEDMEKLYGDWRAVEGFLRQAAQARGHEVDPTDIHRSILQLPSTEVCTIVDAAGVLQKEQHAREHALLDEELASLTMERYDMMRVQHRIARRRALRKMGVGRTMTLIIVLEGLLLLLFLIGWWMHAR